MTEINIAGLGPTGMQVSAQVIWDLYEKGFLEQTSEENNEMEIEEIPEFQDDIGPRPYLRADDGQADILYWGLSVGNDSPREYISEYPAYELVEGKEDKFLDFVHNVRGTGPPVTPKEVLERQEVLEEIKPFIERPSRSFLPFFSLNEGIGRSLMDYESESNGMMIGETQETVFPISLVPEMSFGIKGRKPRTEQVVKGLQLLEKLISDGQLDCCILYDSDFVKRLSAYRKEEYPTLNEIKMKRDPMLRESEFYPFFDKIPREQGSGSVQDGISSTLFPLLSTMGISESSFAHSHIPTEHRIDHLDFASYFNEYFVIPSFIDISTTEKLDETIFQNYLVQSHGETIAHSILYSLLLSGAPFELEANQRVLVFIWEEQDNLDAEVQETCTDLLSSSGLVDRQRVSIHPVRGIEDQSSALKIWTYTGVESVSDTIAAKFDC